ncbi:MAG: phosphotransferase [Spirochaetota bacterium]
MVEKMGINNNLEMQVKEYIKNKMMDNLSFPAGTSYEIADIIVGNYNINYVIKLGEQKFLLRINVEQQSGLTNQMAYEYNTIVHLAKYGVTPAAYYLDSTRKWIPFDFIVQDYIEGKHIDFDDHHAIEDAAAALARLHRVPFPQEDFLVRYNNPLQDLYQEITRMLRQYETRKTCNKNLVTKGEILLKKLKLLVKKNELYFSPVSIVHTDAVNDNFIRCHEGTKIIDWEKPRIDDCTYDLCVFMGRPPQIWASTRLMQGEERNRFLIAYCNNCDIALTELEHKVNIFQPFVSFRWIMWGAHRTADADEGLISSELKEFHSANYPKYKRVGSEDNVEVLLDTNCLN